MMLENSPGFTGSQINYYFVCKRKLWLFSHQIQMEHNSDLVKLGKIIHENAYQREKKEVQIGPIKIDFIGSDGIIHEVKKTPSVEDAHIWQLKYYLYFLKSKGIKDVSGMLNYPKLRKTLKINLSDDDIRKLKNIFIEIKNIIENEDIPEIINKKICKKCSYYDLCYI